MAFAVIKKVIPSWQSALLTVAAAILLVLAFPDFEYWFLAWVALVPLMWAVEREKASTIRSFAVGWLFGTVFFSATCWWLTFAPITYGGFPPVLAYFLLFIVTAAVGLFPAMFAAILSILLRRFGSMAFIAAPIVWVATEFLRYWLTGNNWNAIGYSQFSNDALLPLAGVGGIHLVGAIVCFLNLFTWMMCFGVITAWYRILSGLGRNIRGIYKNKPTREIEFLESYDVFNFKVYAAIVVFLAVVSLIIRFAADAGLNPVKKEVVASVIAIQPNVPMSGLDSQKWEKLRQHQIEKAESEISLLRRPRYDPAQNPVPIEGPAPPRQLPTLVILPESPMNFMYADDREFHAFINDFARRNNTSVLFNSAEPDKTNGKYFNSAVMVGPDGREVAEYDKIYLLPFGEAVPPVLEGIVPGFVGNFSYGREYDLLPVGDAKAGVMICFESHFGQLSRRYVADGADVIIEMTNDGYLGPTPVLRQHLANAVFRAVETHRPVLRVTNVGITAYITETGKMVDPAAAYTEDTRVWSVARSAGTQTFYVRYGDWFAWVCSLITLALLIFAAVKRNENRAMPGTTEN